MKLAATLPESLNKKENNVKKRFIKFSESRLNTGLRRMVCISTEDMELLERSRSLFLGFRAPVTSLSLS